MGFLDKLFGTNKTNAVHDAGTINYGGEGIPAADPDVMASSGIPVSLQKHVVNLEKAVVNLEKQTGIKLAAQAKVAVALDYSGSMHGHWKSGRVQQTLNRLFPMALKFDDNGELEVWCFETGFRRFESMTLGNFENYAEDVVLSSGYSMGGTNYSPVLEDVFQNYFIEEPRHDLNTTKVPVFLIFITDGANDDRKKTDRIIRRLSEHNIYIQFVALGSDQAEFEYLKGLDDLDGRKVDNTGLLVASDLFNMSDDELYPALLGDYPKFLQATGQA